MLYCDSTVRVISKMSQQTSVICNILFLTLLQQKYGMLKTVNIDIIEQIVVILCILYHCLGVSLLFMIV